MRMMRFWAFDEWFIEWLLVWAAERRRTRRPGDPIVFVTCGGDA